MIGKLISLVFFFIVGWVVYTQFFGTEQEQAMGKEVIGNAKETVQGIFNIFQHESGKFKEGTYDDSIDKLGTLLDKLREEAGNEENQQELIQLVQETKRIKEKVEQSKEGVEIDEEQTKEDLKKLTQEVEVIVNKMDEEDKRSKKDKMYNN
jgi:flagellar motility protein MotE (MotC chaperone)